MGSYSDEEMLPLSGIQHYRFCPRQWALIHIEQEWEDNRLTFEGHLLHENVDNPFYRHKHKGVLAMRSVNVASATLGLYGIMDLIELHPATETINAITHPTYAGYWYPYPVEYKHGRPKANISLKFFRFLSRHRVASLHLRAVSSHVCKEVHQEM